jgi:putative redox protein
LRATLPVAKSQGQAAAGIDGMESKPSNLRKEGVAMPADLADPTAGDTVLIAETGLGRLQLVARTACSAFVIDEPLSAGGLGSGPNPYELLSAALGSCTAMTLRLYAERKGWPLGRVQVSVRHRRASLDARDLFERTISVEGALDAAQLEQLLAIAQRCPVHRTLDRGSDVLTTLTPAALNAQPSESLPPEHMRDMEEASRS